MHPDRPCTRLQFRGRVALVVPQHGLDHELNAYFGPIATNVSAMAIQHIQPMLELLHRHQPGVPTIGLRSNVSECHPLAITTDH
jgi:hypothetical protein